MENETQNSVHTNHPHVNGVKDGFVKSGPGLDKGKGPALKETASNYSKMISGHTGNDIKSEAMNTDSTAQKGAGRPGSDSMLDSLRMDDLPDEIQHITTGIMSLGLLLSRLAQVTHNQLQELITTLSTRPFPQNPTADGTPDYRSTTAEDTSPESREKKKLLLDTAEQLHAKWVKALVITEWSRKSEAVGKLIDLRSHIGTQLGHYTDQLMEIAEVKRSLSHARLPSPDLKTALEVLTSGEVSWLPELGYIEPPPLTREQEDRWQEELNTLLSVRLTLYDYEKIPYHFKDYTIDSGRVTFKVKGEFEVDLTIADEDPEKQFWFIDFRFTFTPAPDELTDKTREYLETRVNTALATDSLAGCYRFLHGYTLTHKITEFTRQALELRSGDWADSLKVERLNGAMSIQYWQSRPQSNLKSWIILGVHSGKEAGSVGDRASTSHLSLRWFRDSKELKDLDIPLDFDHISAETTLKTIIAHHVGYILSSIHSKLLDFPRFSKREASLRLTISKDDPSISQLVMSLSRDNDLTVRIDPVTGTIALSPLTRVTLQGERQLNTSGKDPAVEGHIILEKTRCFHAIDELINRGKNMGWLVFQSGVKFDELKPFLNTREAFQTVWIRHVGWTGGDWSVLVTMSLGADKWWLVQT
jgi:mediator of RNA polymerase II transcription subunit 14